MEIPLTEDFCQVVDLAIKNIKEANLEDALEWLDFLKYALRDTMASRFRDEAIAVEMFQALLMVDAIVSVNISYLDPERK